MVDVRKWENPSIYSRWWGLSLVFNPPDFYKMRFAPLSSIGMISYPRHGELLQLLRWCDVGTVWFQLIDWVGDTFVFRWIYSSETIERNDEEEWIPKNFASMAVSIAGLVNSRIIPMTFDWLDSNVARRISRSVTNQIDSLDSVRIQSYSIENIFSPVVPLISSFRTLDPPRLSTLSKAISLHSAIASSLPAASPIVALRNVSNTWLLAWEKKDRNLRRFIKEHSHLQRRHILVAKSFDPIETIFPANEYSRYSPFAQDQQLIRIHLRGFRVEHTYNRNDCRSDKWNSIQQKDRYIARFHPYISDRQYDQCQLYPRRPIYNEIEVNGGEEIGRRAKPHINNLKFITQLSASLFDRGKHASIKFVSFDFKVWEGRAEKNAKQSGCLLGKIFGEIPMQ